MLSYFTDLQGSQTILPPCRTKTRLSYFTDLQGSQTKMGVDEENTSLSYFTDLQGSQTICTIYISLYLLSYFTDLQGSQTSNFGYHRTQHTGICVNQYSIIHCDWSITCILSHNFLVISCDSIIINCTFW